MWEEHGGGGVGWWWWGGGISPPDQSAGLGAHTGGMLNAGL